MSPDTSPARPTANALPTSVGSAPVLLAIAAYAESVISATDAMHTTEHELTVCRIALQHIADECRRESETTPTEEPSP